MSDPIDLATLSDRHRWCPRCLVGAKEPCCFVCGEPMTLERPKDWGNAMNTRYTPPPEITRVPGGIEP